MKNALPQRVMFLKGTESFGEAIPQKLYDSGIHEVLVFDDPYEAIKHLRGDAHIDALLCAFSVSELNGLEFYHIVSGMASTRFLPFIMISLPQFAKVRQKAMAFSDIRDWWILPFSTEEVVESWGEISA